MPNLRKRRRNNMQHTNTRLQKRDMIVPYTSPKMRSSRVVPPQEKAPERSLPLLPVSLPRLPHFFLVIQNPIILQPILSTYEDVEKPCSIGEERANGRIGRTEEVEEDEVVES